MISPSRYEDLHSNFWAETNEEWTQEWRDELAPEEAALVRAWDKRAGEGMAKMCQKILGLEQEQEKSTQNSRLVCIGGRV